MTSDQARKLDELYVWMEERKRQALAYPVDDASRAALRVMTVKSTSTTSLTDTVALTGNAQNINVPKAYTGRLIIEFEGTTYEIPYL